MLEKHLNTLIRRAFQIAKIKSGDVDLNENELNDARYSLNTMLKSWNNRGFHIWKEKTANLILNKNQDKYFLPEDYCFENIYISKFVDVNKVGQYFLPINTKDLTPGMTVFTNNSYNKIKQVFENEIRLENEIFSSFEKDDVVFCGVEIQRTINNNDILEETKNIVLDIQVSKNDTIFLLDSENNWVERKIIDQINQTVVLDKEINNILAGSDIFVAPIIYKRNIEKPLEIEFRGVRIENNKAGFKEDSLIIYFNKDNERIFNKILVVDEDMLVLEKVIDVEIEEVEVEDDEEPVEINSVECNYVVVAFDTPIKKPDTINNAYLYSFINNEKLNINLISRKEFNNLPKSDMSDPTQAYYEKKSEQGVVNIWNKPNSDSLYLQIDYVESLDALESSKEIPDIPDEFIDAVIYNLAYKLGIEYGVPTDDLTILKAEAEDVLNFAEMHDNEDCSIYLQPRR